MSEDPTPDKLWDEALSANRYRQPTYTGGELPWGGTEVVEHVTETPTEPKHTNSETVEKGQRLDRAAAPNTKTTSHRLDELAADYYLFTLAPFYALTGFAHNLIYRFGVELNLEKVPNVLDYRAPAKLLEADLGDQDYRLAGIPAEYADLFKKFLLQVCVTDSKTKAYWRIDAYPLYLPTPTVVSSPAPVTVYVPSGRLWRVKAVPTVRGTVQFMQAPPDKNLAAEADAYYGVGGLHGGQ